MKFQNNETAAILVFQTNPVGVGLFSYKNNFFCSHKHLHRCWRVSENHLLQSEAIKCEAIDKKTTFYSHVTKTHFHKKGFALSLVSKVRVLGA